MASNALGSDMQLLEQSMGADETDFGTPHHSTKRNSLTPSAVPRAPKVRKTSSLSKERMPAAAVSVPPEYRQFTLSLSPLYNSSKPETYYEQCFVTLDVLGRGSFGVVYKSFSREDGKEYAVKMVPYRSMYDRFEKLNEVDKLMKIPQNKYCVELYFAWEDNDVLFMQFELCDMSLDKYARNNHYIPEDYVWNIFVDVLQGLKYLHDMNFVHLDIKLQNILIGFDGVCKLADFGIVTDLSKPSDASDGDSKYLAVEVMNGRITKAADIFSLGMSLLELGCDLDLPKSGFLWRQMRHGEFPQEETKRISAELMNLIKEMLRFNYEQRPSISMLFEHPKIKSILAERRRAAVVSKMKICGTFFLDMLSHSLNYLVKWVTFPFTPQAEEINRDNVQLPDVAEGVPNKTPPRPDDFDMSSFYEENACPAIKVDSCSSSAVHSLQSADELDIASCPLTDSEADWNMSLKPKGQPPGQHTSTPINRSRLQQNLFPDLDENMQDFIASPILDSPAKDSSPLSESCKALDDTNLSLTPLSSRTVSSHSSSSISRSSKKITRSSPVATRSVTRMLKEAREKLRSPNHSKRLNFDTE